jgi:hypothetical protein
MAPELPFLYEEQRAERDAVVVPLSAVRREPRTREASAASID